VLLINAKVMKEHLFVPLH